jgi:hypothetical protein
MVGTTASTATSNDLLPQFVFTAASLSRGEKHQPAPTTTARNWPVSMELRQCLVDFAETKDFL